MIKAEINKDSVSLAGVRLTTFILTYARFIHSELMTHRMFSRNAASSRAIPLKKTIAEIEVNPALPVSWPRNQKGMQASENLSALDGERARVVWLEAAKSAITHAKELEHLGMYKQIANRILEPWMHMTTIVTATEWENFFSLRVDRAAQPEFQELAYQILKPYVAGIPESMPFGGWHIPFSEHMPEAIDLEMKFAIAVGRVARISYKNQDGNYSADDDAILCNRLSKSGHWSPFEHVAQARMDRDLINSNFRGWTQYRKFYKDENRRVVDLNMLLAAYEFFRPELGISYPDSGNKTPGF